MGSCLPVKIVKSENQVALALVTKLTGNVVDATTSLGLNSCKGVGKAYRKCWDYGCRLTVPGEPDKRAPGPLRSLYKTA